MQNAVDIITNVEDLLLAFWIPGDPVIARTYQVQLALPNGQLGMTDLANAAVSTRDFLESRDDVTTLEFPESAIEWPAAKLPVIAINNAVITGSDADWRQ